MQVIKKRFLLLSCLLGMTTNAEVIPVYQINEAPGTYVQTTLTHDVYRYSADTQLNDLVVIDAQGNKLPYRITAPSTQVNEQSQLADARFFPVAVGAPPEALIALSSASIRLDANEISVSVEKTTNDKLQDQSAPVDFYVVDVSDLKTRIDKLVVDWQVTEANQYLEVQVSGTNDLTTWSNIAQTTLVQLQKEGQLLTRNKISINLSEKQYAYLRLKFTRGNENLQLRKIQIENTDKVANAPVVDSWEVKGALAEDQDSELRAGNHTTAMPVAAWEFARDDIAPVANISLNLGTLMYGDNIKVFSRNTEKQPWQLLHQGIWFNTQVGSDWQQSDAINIYSNSDIYLRVELNELVRTTLNPTLVFHRQPQILQFIANNAPPYKIAIDDQAAPNSQQTSTQIFSQLVSGKELQWGQVAFTELNPSMDSFARHGMQMSWKTLLFWGILILAVAVLVGVAIRLMGQMNAKVKS
ncbi:DUF3999 family protein [Cellvibrio sp. UBA7671]|uniref:DUF3999 family protein n=1 Tax=Cellvibrio sp. UBA7671 TaxID=1946312 RepID=UPI002F35427E